ncbi:MAG: riboflavin biosynthesis protein RibF [Cardiobacteriaceae bacterium]|nr:riboflavin biosynthesis protein RibF [Cardiobacteriaceae bacterium]
MQIHRWQRSLTLPSPVALAIGNFDGVHRGHQAILTTLAERAKEQQFVSMLLSFFPHPKTLITGHSPSILTPLRDRAYWLAQTPLQHWLLLSFTHVLMQKEPEDFIRDYLLPLRLGYLLVGDDFRFGYRGRGDFSLLQRFAARSGYQVESLQTVMANGTRISSSLIRTALAEHDMERVRHLLGHDLTFTGKVQYGAGRGHELRTPTANLHLPDNWCLPDGVYVVKVATLPQTTLHWGVANVGTTPTFHGKRRKLEVHILGQTETLYGRTLRVQIMHYLRDVQQFADADALKNQIRQDIHNAQAYINQESHHGRL